MIPRTWDHLVEQRRMARIFGIVLFVMALLISFRPSIQVPVASLLGVLAMQMLMASQMLGRLADLQAALDMKSLYRKQAQ